MKRAKGFTLVELLVVIGIIALLISILLPTLGRARQSANSVECMSNLRQLGLGIQMYANANQGSLPVGYWPAEGSNGGFGTEWDLLVLNALSNKFVTNYQGGTSASAYSQVAQLRKLVRDTDTQQSAEDAGITVCEYSSHPRLMPNFDPQNSFYPDPAITTSTVPLTPYHLAKVRRSSEVVMLFCGAQIQTNQQGAPGIGAWWGADAVGFGLDGNQIIAGGASTGGNGGKNGSGGSTSSSTKDYLLFDYPSAHNGSPIDPGPNYDFGGDVNNITPAASSPFQPAGQPRWRHMNNTVCNFLFCDGHVESHHYKSTGFHTGTCDLYGRNVNVNSK
jgi:prepilin-type N-terminal cleavage/methylation domain-containing protein/prepilin-type processing-associated H-X9-DG protein